MQEQVRVEIVPRTVATDEATRARREEAVRQLGELGHIDPASGEVSATETRWSARIASVEFPVEMFGVEPDAGRVLVSLVVDAASVQIGDPSTGSATPQIRAGVPQQAEKVAAVWGAAGVPDPREGVPGWSRPASTGEASTLHVSFEPQEIGPVFAEALNRLIRIENLATAAFGVRRRKPSGRDIAARMQDLGLIPRRDGDGNAVGRLA